ncbi:MAG TPA: cobalt ECF transporter T component CbiQ [Desulfuromonadales bacterium]|nr:cobalt ECF transporter T component CbiQ [Desulfuromonadales bacterium]
MNRITAALLDLKRLELLAHGDSSIHRIHPLAKTVVVIAFIALVVSCNRYQISALLPFAVFPIVVTSQSGLPPVFILKKIILLLPLLLCAALFNPIFDRESMLQIGSVTISGGWISFFSIQLRSVLTIGSAFILIGTTGLNAVCQALRCLGLPAVFTTQLLFLQRYIFVLAEESARASLARELRSCGNKGQGIASYGSLVGQLLLRTFGRAERVHAAMLARGFTGELHDRRARVFKTADLRFVIGWVTLFLIFRLHNLPMRIGSFVTATFP